MSGPTIQTTKNGNSRYYIHPTTGERAAGVTSIIGMLPKEFLKWWASKVVAEEAVNNFSALAGMILADTPGAKSGAVDWLKRAPLRTTSEAATRGTRVHDWTERVDIEGTIPRRVPREILPYITGYLQFREQTGAEILKVETTVWDDESNYSGTLDRTILLPKSAFDNYDSSPSWYEGQDVPIVADVKTSRSGVFEEVALQIAAYRAASHYMKADEHGEFKAEPMEYHSKTGLVIHLRPDAWRLVPTNSGLEAMRVFWALRVIFDWDKTTKKKALYPDIAGNPLEAEDVAQLAAVLEAIK